MVLQDNTYHFASFVYFIAHALAHNLATHRHGHQRQLEIALNIRDVAGTCPWGGPNDLTRGNGAVAARRGSKV